MPQSMNAYLWTTLVGASLCEIHEIGSNILWGDPVSTYVAKYFTIDPITKGAPRWTAEEMNMTKTAWQEVGMISLSIKFS